MINVKRIYDNPSKEDGYRILVDKFWPRGISKDNAKVDLWLKETAPSDKLRKWFNHEPSKWEDFKKRYLKELEMKTEVAQRIRSISKDQHITLLYGAKDIKHNHAIVIKIFLEKYGL